MRKFFLFVFSLTISLYAGTIDVAKYNKHSPLEWVWAVTTLNELHLEGNEMILDIGCGDGKFTSVLASKVPNGFVLGIEPFPEVIEFAQEKYQAQNLAFKTEELSYFEQFDVVTCFLTLNWLQDSEIEIMMDQIAKALKSEGVGLFTIPAPAKNNTWREIFQKIMLSDQVKPYGHLFEFQNRMITVDKIKAWVAKANLHLEKIDFVETSIIFHDRNEVKEWLLALNPRLNQMPTSNLDYFVDQYIAFLSMVFPQAQDSRIYLFPEKMVIKVSKRN